jgi:hypothetical protein
MVGNVDCVLKGGVRVRDSVRSRCRRILSLFESVSLPVKSLDAYNDYIALYPSYWVHYRTWQREILRLGTVGRLNVEVRSDDCGGHCSVVHGVLV